MQLNCKTLVKKHELQTNKCSVLPKYKCPLRLRAISSFINLDVLYLDTSVHTQFCCNG